MDGPAIQVVCNKDGLQTVGLEAGRFVTGGIGGHAACFEEIAAKGGVRSCFPSTKSVPGKLILALCAIAYDADICAALPIPSDSSGGAMDYI